MLTIKHVTEGGEILVQANEVTYHDETTMTARSVGYLADKEWKSISGSGVVYVMNDTGKTVATYALWQAERPAA